MKILKKITDKKILYIFTVAILFFIPILKQGSFYFVRYGIVYNHDSINPAIVLYISLPFFIYLYVKDLIKTKRDFDIFDKIFFILVTAGIVVTLLAIDKEMSLFGKAYRHEGFLTILSYYLMFITWKSLGTKEDLKKVLKIILWITIINCIYAVLQLYTKSSLILRFTVDSQMATGLLGNPNFFGTVVVTALGIVTPKILLEKNFSIKNSILLLFLYLSLINSQSTGPFLTYIIVLIFLIIYLIIKKKILMKNTIILVLCLILLYPLIVTFNREVFNLGRCEMCDFADTITSESKEDVKNATYTINNGRLEIWKNSLNIAKKNLITGVGYDNLYLAYYEGINLSQVYFVTVEGQLKAFKMYPEIVDNAHNIYLNTFVTSGLIGLLPYLLLCLLTFIKALKTNNNLVICLLGGFVAYSVQGFVNINVIQAAPIYFLIIGVILSIKE